MNKTVIKNFAVDVHKLLVEQIKVKAYQYGVTDNSCPELNTESINGKLLSDMEKSQLNALVKTVNIHGYNHVIEEVAYTWFNRFIALRYMEVNNNLPQKIRVFTNENNEFKPEILAEAIHLDLEGLDKQKVFDLIDTNNQDELYKYLLLAICNDMNKYLPEMFTAFDQQNYKVLLMPDGLLKEDSIISKLIRDIPEEDWKESKGNDGTSNEVTMIGWMYQYYISQRHNEVVNISKGTVSKEDIPAATELFTTDWVVRYMVDNSLGRYWIERNPNSELRNKLKYLATGKDGSLPIVENDPKKPEELTFFDPCMGSGHILSYAFDVLMEIYRECGWRDRDAAVSIVENNLYGLDIDERAYQLAYFSIMMKGCLYNRRFLKIDVSNHLSNIVETNDLDSLTYFGMEENEECKQISTYLLDTFKDALELGSLIEVETKDFESYGSYINNIYNTAENTSDYYYWKTDKYGQIIKLIKQAKILSNKYCITTTNPPYLNKMSGELKKYVVKNYKAYSSDLFAVFIKRNFDFTVENGYLGFMTPFVWMFIKSYEELRRYIIDNKSIATLVQMEYSAYEEATVPICSFVLRNIKTNDAGYYFRLSDFKGGMEIQQQKVLEAIYNRNCGYFFETSIKKFNEIPGSPIAYWASNAICEAFNSKNRIISIGAAKVGIGTGNTDLFLRLWHEIDINKFCFSFDENSTRYWIPINKGGQYRKWYGNQEYVINWKNHGNSIINYCGKDGKKLSYPRNLGFQGKESLTWGDITSGPFSMRYSKEGFYFSDVGNSLFLEDKRMKYYVLANCNTKPFLIFNSLINSTIHFKPGNMENMPCIVNAKQFSYVSKLAQDCIDICKHDWDSFENSWDFTIHPLVKNRVRSISEAYSLWDKECTDRFNQLKVKEEELNRIFIDVYNLNNELDPYEDTKDVTVRKGDLTRDIKLFISYAVGCMLGRYSLDTEGLAYAGGDWDNSKYKTFIPDVDDIIPVCDEEYFEDDIVSRFVEFVRCIYGEETLEENLQFISDALGGKGNPRDVLRDYFIKDFFKNHCKIYQKRPIYWLFDSGKKNGFKALVYIHRYTPDLIAKMRTGYIHPLQSQYRTQIEMLNNQIDEASSMSEKVKLKKQLKKINEQAEELGKYEEKIHHWADKMEPMDLDDGVKVNYAKFQELLVKIK